MKNSSQLTVLVVDDALTIRTYHKTLLEQLGFSVIESENGMEALERVAELPLSLCLVDVNMPVMDGYTFVTELRQGDYNADCPVIMITTESRESEESRGYECGANLYLVKPADPDQLKTYCELMVDRRTNPATGEAAAPLDHSTDNQTAAPNTAAKSGLLDYFNEMLSE